MQLESLTNSAELFRSFFLEHPEPMWLYDRQSLAFLLVNTAAIEKYGYSEAEFLAMTIADIRPVEDLDALAQTLLQQTVGVKKAGVWRHRKKNGELIQVEITSQLIADNNGEAVLVCARDITEQLALAQQNQKLLQAETAQRLQLEHSLQLLNIASQSGRLGGWRVELQSMQVEWSAQTALIHGFSQPQILTAEQAINFYTPAHRQLVKERFNRCARYGTGYDEIFQLTINGSKPKWVRAIGEAEYDNSGAIIAVRGAFQDIDELVRTQDELAQLRQRLLASEEKVSEVTTRSISMQQHAQQLTALAKLTGGIAHDYNNLLTVIISNTELLVEQLNQEPDLARSAMLSLTAAQKASRLTQHLLAFGQQQQLKAEIHQISELLKDAIQLLGHALPPDIQLSCNNDVSDTTLCLDKTQFELALLNIALNAREAMPFGGRLTISAYATTAELLQQHQLDAEQHYLCLQIEDNGCGMTTEIQQRAFEPFFTTKPLGEGYGLGLSMVYGFAQQSGGTAYIDAAFTDGCRLGLILPVAELSADANQTTKLPTGALRVLLVEDDELLQQHLNLVLLSAGYRVVTADTADAAPAILQRQPIDILLSDIITPGKTNGIELAYWVRTTFPAVKILLNSGYYDVEQHDHQQLLSDFPYIAKPYKTADLLQKLSQL